MNTKFYNDLLALKSLKNAANREIYYETQETTNNNFLTQTALGA